MFRKDAQMKDLVNLGKRIYFDKMIVNENLEGDAKYQDEQLIKDICNKTFGTLENPKNPTTNNIELFNEFLAQTVEEITEPSVKEILNLLAEFRKVPAGTVYKINLPKTAKPKYLFTAKGTGVDLARIDGGVQSRIAEPESLTYGGYYEMNTFRADPVRAVREAVDKLGEAKLDLYFKLIFDAFKSAITSSKIPANNIASGTNLSLAEYQQVEQTMIRLGGGRPLMVADTALLDHFANQVITEQPLLLTDSVKDMLREELVPSMISKTPCLAFPNQWIDDQNTKVKFNPSYGFVFPSATKVKPFAITEFGATRQYSKMDVVTEQVELKIVFEANIMLINTREIGAVVDDSITIA